MQLLSGAEVELFYQAKRNWPFICTLPTHASNASRPDTRASETANRGTPNANRYGKAQDIPHGDQPWTILNGAFAKTANGGKSIPTAVPPTIRWDSASTRSSSRFGCAFPAIAAATASCLASRPTPQVPAPRRPPPRRRDNTERSSDSIRRRPSSLPVPNRSRGSASWQVARISRGRAARPSL
jgi:hypothetical protein